MTSRILCAAALILGGGVWAAAQAAPSLQSYSLTAGGRSQLGAIAGQPFSCATFGPDARTGYFQGIYQVALPTDGSICGVGVDARDASASTGSVQVAATLAVGFGTSGDPRAFVGNAQGRAGYGDLGVRAAASYSGQVDSFTVIGSQAFGMQTDTLSFGGASGNGTFRPTFTVDGSLFNVGRTDSELGFHYSVGNGAHYLAFRIQNSRGAVSYYTPGGYVASLPGMVLSGDLVSGLTVSGSTSFSIDIPIVFGAAVDYTFALWAGSLPSSSVGLLGPSAGDVSFASSARLTGIQLFNVSGQALSTFTVDSGSGTLYGPGGVIAVPEPSTWLLMGAGLGALLWRRRGEYSARN